MTYVDEDVCEACGCAEGADRCRGGRIPGRGMGTAGFVLAFLLAPVGLGLSIVSVVRAHRAGRRNRLAVAGIVVAGALMLIVPLLMSHASAVCRDLGPGVHVVNRVTYTCS